MNDNRKLALNLQRFDADTNTTLSPGLSGEMKTFYEDTLIDLAEPELLHEQFADKYPIPKNGGKTIEFRKYDSLPKALTPITEGVTPKGNKLSMTTMTAEIDQYGDWIQLSDVLQLTSIDNNVVQATKLLGSQSGRTLDTVCRDVLAGGTNVYYQTKGDGTAVTSRTGLDATCVLTPTTIKRVAAILKGVNAQKIDGSFVAIIHPYVAEDIMEQDGWIDVVKYGKQEHIFNGEIGKIGGVRFVESTEAKIWKDDSCPDGLAVFSTLVMGAHAYATTEIAGGGLQHIVKQLGYGDDPLNQRSSCGWKAITVTERLIEQYMIRIESVSVMNESVTEAN